jgi:hypothetical protein
MQIHRKNKQMATAVATTTSAIALLACSEARAVDWVFDGTDGVVLTGGPGGDHNDGRSSGLGMLYTGSSEITAGTNPAGHTFANGRFVDGLAQSKRSSGGMPASAGGSFNNWREVKFNFVRVQSGTSCIVNINRTADVAVSGLNATGNATVFVYGSNVSAVNFSTNWGDDGGPVRPQDHPQPTGVIIPQGGVGGINKAQLSFTFGVYALGGRTTETGNWDAFASGRVTVMPPL